VIDGRQIAKSSRQLLCLDGPAIFVHVRPSLVQCVAF
jgi:hypothetical protein